MCYRMYESLDKGSTMVNSYEVMSFFKDKGHIVVRTDSCWWYDPYRNKRVLCAFPYHSIVLPPMSEIDQIFHETCGILAIRFAAPVHSRVGKESAMYVCRSPYNLSKLSSNTRSKVRRGMKRCVIRSISWRELMEYGWEAQIDTMKRHRKRVKTMGMTTDLSKCKAYEVWGAFVDNHLAAYVITLSVEDYAHILVSRSANAYLKFYPNNALIFTVVRELLARPDISTVSFGLAPLHPAPSLEKFKLSMGFTPLPVRDCIVLSPRIKFMLNPATCRLVEIAGRIYQNHHKLQCLAGFCARVRATWSYYI